VAISSSFPAGLRGPYLVVERSGINGVVGGWVAENDNVTVWGKRILAVDLLLSSIVGWSTSTVPGIDVAFAAVVEVIGALLAIVLI